MDPEFRSSYRYIREITFQAHLATSPWQEPKILTIPDYWLFGNVACLAAQNFNFVGTIHLMDLDRITVSPWESAWNVFSKYGPVIRVMPTPDPNGIFVLVGDFKEFPDPVYYEVYLKWLRS